MSPGSIRQKLHSYLEAAEEEKRQALYIVIQHDVETVATAYTPEFRAELDRRYAAYLSDKTAIVSSSESKARIEQLIADARANEA